jgi:hypothetical protein
MADGKKGITDDEIRKLADEVLVAGKARKIA